MSVVNSLTLSFPYVNCLSVFIDNFKFYRDFVFADNLRVSTDIPFLTIPCISHDSFFAIDLMRQSWIHCRCWLHMSVVTQYSLTISSSQGLYFRWRFMDQQWHSVFDNSMPQPWLTFCCRIDASVMNSLKLSITYVWCHSVFIDDFKFNRDSVFADDLWISSAITFLTIPCIKHDSIFAIYLMRRSWIHWHCWFHTSTVSQYSLTISSSIGTLFSLTIYGLAMTYCFWQFNASAMTLFLLSISCIGHDFIDAVDYICFLSLSIH